MDLSNRAARNEEIFRNVNQRIEAGAERHQVRSELPFHCECGSGSCVGKLALSPGDYERVARERYRFLLIRGHENPEIERVVEEHEEFVVVEKIGEARKQIDRDHPRPRHDN